MKKNLKIFFVFVSLVLAQSLSSFSYGQTTVYIDPPSVTLSGQSTVMVSVYIANVTNLRSWSVDVSFDNSKLDIQTIAKGPFLSNNGSHSTFFGTQPSVSNITNSVSVDESILGSGISVSGSGLLFTMEFAVLSAGVTSITIVDVDLKDVNNDPISCSWSSGEVNIPIAVNTKAFLEGPFETSVMSTYLNSSDLLPLQQPYNEPPWNYTGSESVSSEFFQSQPDITDWILIEIRSSTSSTTMIERKAGFIKKTGEIVGIDGVNPIYIIQPPEDYYIVIYHRNHLGIMSSIKQPLDYYSGTYDFTNSQTKAYGSSAMIDLGSGYFGMIAGDANGNGQVQNNDSESYWRIQNGQAGYKSADFNLNGQVQNNDRESYWRINNGKGTQVP